MENIKVFYHNRCNDGLVAAWAVNQYAKAWSLEAEFVPLNHGDEIDINSLEDKTVFFVDICPTYETTYEIALVCESLIIYDHHITSYHTMTELPDVMENVHCVYADTKSGAGIAWDELIPKPRPFIVEAVEHVDLWKERNTQKGKDYFAFAEALRSMPETFEQMDTVYSICKDETMLNTFINLGHGMLKHKNMMVDHAVEFAEDISIDVGGTELKTKASNVPYFLCSEVGAAIADEHEVGVTYFKTEDHKWKVSLRSVGDSPPFAVDIAKQYGGGGHKHAAGFTCKELPWKYNS